MRNLFRVVPIVAVLGILLAAPRAYAQYFSQEPELSISYSPSGVGYDQITLNPGVANTGFTLYSVELEIYITASGGGNNIGFYDGIQTWNSPTPDTWIDFNSPGYAGYDTYCNGTTRECVSGGTGDFQYWIYVVVQSTTSPYTKQGFWFNSGNYMNFDASHLTGSWEWVNAGEGYD